MAEVIDKELAYWIFYEDGKIYYCQKCIHERLNEIDTNKEFSQEIDYENGETCGFFTDYADEDCEIECCKCSKPLLSNIDNS